MSNVNHPEHYNRFSHEVIDLVKDMGFCQGNVIKYILRAPFKGHYIEDLEKAIWYARILRRAVPYLWEEQEDLALAFGKEMEAYDKDLAEVVPMFVYGRPTMGDIADALQRIVDKHNKEGKAQK